MDQLLSIKHIPIKIEVNVTNAEFRRKEGEVPSVKVMKGSSGVQVEAQPYKVDITSPRFDTYTPSATQERGVKITYDAVAKLAGDENGVKTADSGSDIAARSSSYSSNAGYCG